MSNSVHSDEGSGQNQSRYDAFISYSSKDGDWVRGTLLPRLEKEGLRICIDFRDFEIGEPSLVNMEKGVGESRKTILVLTPNWVASQWTEFESLLIQTNDPVGRGRRILPVLLQACSLPDRLRIFTYLDMTDKSNFDFQIKRLVAAIRSTPVDLESTTAGAGPAPSRPAARRSGYEVGLGAMGKLLSGSDRDTKLAFSVLESRLWDNLQFERRYGTNETIRTDRARIVEELNRLALDCLDRTFNELCQA